MQDAQKKNLEKEFTDSSSWCSSPSLACSLQSTFSSSLSSLSSSPPSPSLVISRKKVSFSTVSCRFYKREQGGSCAVPSKGGFSLGLSWDLCEKCPEKTFLLDVYEGLIPPPAASTTTSPATPLTSKNARKKQRRKQENCQNGLVFPQQTPCQIQNQSQEPPSNQSQSQQPEMAINHHKSRFYPNYKGRPEDSLRVIAPGKRKQILSASGCSLDVREAQQLVTIREQRKDVGCLCSVVPGMGKGRTCRDPQLCECAANDIQCHADCCECLNHHKRRKAASCKNAHHFYVYDETGVDKQRRKRLKELAH